MMLKLFGIILYAQVLIDYLLSKLDKHIEMKYGLF